MQSLKTHRRNDAETQNSNTLMVGTSAGIRNVHDPASIPFDTVTYLLRAESARKNIGNTNGLLFVLDKRLDDDATDQAAIDQRTDHLRQLISAVSPHFSVTTHQELEERGLASTIDRVDPLISIDNEELRQYSRVQTAHVLQLKEERCNEPTQSFTKFGWVLSRRKNGDPIGGEANFDALIPKSIGIDTIYTAPAFPVTSTQGKAPYLLNESDRNTRVCLVENKADIGNEVCKVQSGIHIVTHNTLRAAAETILNLQPETHASTDELTNLPLSTAMKKRITDEVALTDLRELLAASLEKLLL